MWVMIEGVAAKRRDGLVCGPSSEGLALGASEQRPDIWYKYVLGSVVPPPFLPPHPPWGREASARGSGSLKVLISPRPVEGSGC